MRKTVCKIVVVLSVAIAGCATAPQATYPDRWWTPVPREGVPSWEILPQEAKPGEVILSKRNELGILSNFAATPFTFRGADYASVEGFWQMMKYPEGPNDPRAAAHLQWAYARDQVALMTGFEAKRAGDLASANMKTLGIDWVTFEHRRILYRSTTRSKHYQLIVEAMRAKLRQNPKVRETLMATGDLILKPDHHQSTSDPDEWRYFEIWMQIRDEIRRGTFR